MKHDKKKVAYISGQMTGIHDHNRERFYEVEEIVQNMGYEVVNPARMDDDMGIDGHSWQNFLRRDIFVLADKVDLVVVFDSWQKSRGATDEVYAAITMGIPVKRLGILQDSDTLKQVPYLYNDVELPVPMEAKQIVLGKRRYDYGHPAENFKRTALLIDGLLKPKLREGESIDIRDVAMIMVQVKIAREYNSPKRDNMVDVCGYAYAYQETLDELERRGLDIKDQLSSGPAKTLHNNYVEGAFD